MKNRAIIYVSISLLLTAICYLLTSSIFISAGVIFISILSFFFIIDPIVKAYKMRNSKDNEAYHFINSFIISLSASKSLETSFQNAFYSLNEEEKKAIESLGEITFEEKMDYLGKYFQSDIFKVFLSIIRLYQEEGGDILDMASSLLKESTSSEEERVNHEKNVIKAFFEFSSLWVMSLLVMGILRFSLASFYSSLITNSTFLLLIVIYFIIAIGSFVMFAVGLTNEKIKFKGAKKI